MKTESKSNRYSNFFILVCNVPSVNDTDDLQKSIISGLINKWKVKHQDPRAERIHIIYLSATDKPNAKKFQQLNQVDERSRIYIVGHSSPGSDTIYSDETYLLYDNTTQKYVYQAHHFTHSDLALILLANIKNVAVIKPRSQINDFDPSAQKLKICVTPCNSAIQSRNSRGEIQPSFCEKFFNSLVNGESILNCDIVGSNGFLFPFPTTANITLTEIKHLLKGKGDLLGKSFHKRYWLVDNNRIMSLIPRHKTGNYKTTFVIPPATDEQPIRPLLLSPILAQIYFSHRVEMQIIFQALRKIPHLDKVVTAEKTRAILLLCNFLKTKSSASIQSDKTMYIELLSQHLGAAIFKKTADFSLFAPQLGIRFAEDKWGLNSIFYQNSLSLDSLSQAHQMSSTDPISFSN